MTIKEYQTRVDKWIKNHGVRYFDEMTNSLLLVEEVGEWARLIARTYGEQSFKSSESQTDTTTMLADEWADIFFVLTCLANQTGIDVEAAIHRNVEKKTNRDAQRHKGNKKLGVEK